MNKAAQQLSGYLDRIERLEDERKALADDIADIYKELDGEGYDKAAAKIVLKIRRNPGALSEWQDNCSTVDLYLSALGMVPETIEHRAPARTRENIEQFVPETGEKAFLGPHSQEVDDGQPHPSSNVSGAKNDGAQTIAGRADDRSGLSITQLEQQDASASQDRNEPISDSEATVTHSNTTLAASPEASRKAGEGVLLPLSPAANPDDDVPDFLKRDIAPARKTAADFRPNCLRPDACASSGLHHCYQCEKASETMEGELA